MRYQQPRMEIEITNLTDNNIIGCSPPLPSSLTAPNILPGFFQSPNPGTGNPVWCKDWTAVSISLDGHAGKRIRLFSKRQTARSGVTSVMLAILTSTRNAAEPSLAPPIAPDDAFINVQALWLPDLYLVQQQFYSNAGGQQVLTPDAPASHRYNDRGSGDSL